MEKQRELNNRIHCIRQLMHEHVQSRLKHALSKLDGKKDDAAIRQRKKAAEDKYQLDLILEKGANAASKIVVASHIAKGTNPDLKVKDTSNLNIKFSMLPSLHEMGSHTLNVSASLMDTTGDGAYNSAAYELYLLLDCEFEGSTLGHHLQQNDKDVIDAFQIGKDDKDFAMKCCALLDSKCSKPAVNTLSKQIYWLENDADPFDDSNFEVLVPLFPASLVHQAYLEIQTHRFGEANKAARDARRERRAHDGVFHDYPGLAVQKMGGTKPQNISQLNSERGGINYLLSSLPPSWTASAQRLPVGATSVFEHLFPARPLVQRTVKRLRKFLASEPESNLATREYRDALIDSLIDELVVLAGELQQQPAGWSKAKDHNNTERFAALALDEKLWLDPMRAELPEEGEFAQLWLTLDWPAAIGKRFAQWLNHQLKGELAVGDAEAKVWAKALLSDEDGFKQRLRELRQKLDTAHYSSMTPQLHNQEASV